MSTLSRNITRRACHRLRAARSRHFSLWNLFRRSSLDAVPPPGLLLTQDNLFHPFSRSPIPAIVERGKTVRELAPCPVCSTHHSHTIATTSETVQTVEPPKSIAFECPDCGWPTHCSEEHWKADEEHKEYCARLREVNEDEHDLRSGRTFPEFGLPGEQPWGEAVNFSNWDVFWYTRGFPSIDTMRSKRHATKPLTFPMTISHVLHEYAPYTSSSPRLTPSGSRSLAAIRSTLHVPSGSPDDQHAGVGKATVRIWMIGSRSESRLPWNVWEQMGFLFPSVHFHLFFVGDQISLPDEDTWKEQNRRKKEPPKGELWLRRPEKLEEFDELKEDQVPPPEPVELQVRPNSSPKLYQPPTPLPLFPHSRTRNSIQKYGVPSYTVPYTPYLTVTGLRAKYQEVHPLFESTFDPYSDVFVFFCPGFGFPSPTAKDQDGLPKLQINSPDEWQGVLPSLLDTRCMIISTAFSPTDLERDVSSLDRAEGVRGEYEWVIKPGENEFRSEKWEVADFDPRVMIRSNWGVWAIRGKGRDIREKTGFWEKIGL